MDWFGIKRRRAEREKRAADEAFHQRLLMAYYCPAPPSRETLQLKRDIEADRARMEMDFQAMLDRLTSATPPAAPDTSQSTR